MSTFAIALKGKEYLDTPVFEVGPDGKEVSIAIFTERELAEKYIDDADWADRYEPGELKPIQMLNWFTIAREKGCDMVAINPDRQAHLEGKRQSVAYLGDPLEAFVETLQSKLATSESSREALQT